MPVVRIAAILTLLVPVSALGQSLQNGFYYHDPATLQIESAASGLICSDAQGGKSLCEATKKIIVTGEDICDFAGGEQIPCTNFGYEFTYSGATPDTQFECQRTLFDPRSGEFLESYERPVSGEEGRVSFLTFRTNEPVSQQQIASEVHNCSYLGERVATIEFIIYFEPDTAGNTDEDEGGLYFPLVPDACASPYLTESMAANLLNAPGANKHAASYHLPELRSQCIYGAAGGPSGQVGYEFRFALSDMFDLEQVPLQQVDFNASFANGGEDPEKISNSPGGRAYYFQSGDRATLFMITGIKGRADPTGRPNEFVAIYYIEDPDMGYETKKGALTEQALLQMDHWMQELGIQ